MEISKFEEILNNLYRDACEWLKFAEAKNAALLGFNGVMLFGTANIIKEKMFPDFSIILKFSLLIFCLNIVLIMITFIPKQVPILKKKQKNLSNGLYYNEIGNHEPENYIDLVIKRYNVSSDDVKHNYYILDLVNQIVSVSWLTTRKNKMFKLCSFMNISLFVVVFFLILILYITKWFL